VTRRDRFSLPLADGRILQLGGETAVMGVLNVTPDSFSDGGRFTDPETAVRHAESMLRAGAAIVDVGGESTRPGSAGVDEAEEIRRIVPVIRAIRRNRDAVISVDTSKASVARAAVEAGADMVNDVTALRDPEMPSLIAGAGVPVILMHMRGTPETMQSDTDYGDLTSSVIGFLRNATEKAIGAGISGDKIVVDPGIGFGKSPQGNLEILRRLPILREVGKPVLVGASRKSFIGAVLDLPVAERREPSLAAAVVAVWQGAHMVRVHDVVETVRVVRMVDAILHS
jgi:dihydropteroate synthase